MAYQAIFQRYEMKYLITAEQKQKVLSAMAPYMTLDKYGRTVIRNLYFDTPDYRLIRHSIEKPPYKEKLRIRSYALATPESSVFIELKKKYDSIVYKRRLSMPEQQAMDWLVGGQDAPEDTQIVREIDYFLHFYPELKPMVYLSYAREAYFCNAGSSLRITFDDDILCRQDRLTLTEPPGGDRIIPEGMALMEIKCAGGYPLWLTSVLSGEQIRRTSFSKYGTAYQKLIFPKLQGGHQHV